MSSIPTTQAPPDPDAFLAGGGGKSASFASPGDKVQGEIVAYKTTQQTKFGTGELEFWKDGSPMWQVVVTLKTDLEDGPDDDGLRNVYLRGGLKRPTTQRAVADALKAAGQPKLQVGATLGLAYTGEGASTGKGNPPKEYVATYRPPVAPADIDGLFND